MRRSLRGFTLLELLVSMALLIVVASGSFVLLASAKQLAQKPSHRSDGVYFASETLETLRDYVTATPTRENPPLTLVYRLVGDVDPYALTDLGGPNHIHVLPTAPDPRGFFKDTLGGTRTYVVQNVDVAPLFDSDGDGNPANDVSYQRVTVTVQWTEQK